MGTLDETFEMFEVLGDIGAIAKPIEHLWSVDKRGTTGYVNPVPKVLMEGTQLEIGLDQGRRACWDSLMLQHM